MMNAELHAAGQVRIIVPTSFRVDYLDGMRMLSRRGDPSILISGMRHLHNFTASLDFGVFEVALRELVEANAMDDSGDILDTGQHRDFGTRRHPEAILPLPRHDGVRATDGDRPICPDLRVVDSSGVGSLVSVIVSSRDRAG